MTMLMDFLCGLPQLPDPRCDLPLRKIHFGMNSELQQFQCQHGGGQI